MGNGNVAPPPLTPETIEKALQDIIANNDVQFQENKIRQPLSTLMRHFKVENIFEKVQGKFKTNKVLLSLVFNPLFTRQILKMLKLLTDKLQQWNKITIKSLKVKDFEFMFLLGNFLLLVSNEKLLGVVDSLLIRSDLQNSTQILIEQIKKSEEPPEVIGNLVERMSFQEKQEAQKLLRIIIIEIIKMKSKTFARSEQTIKYIDLVEESLFMLYTKLYFNKDDENIQLTMKQHYRSNVTMGAYFLSAGSSRIKPSMYETSVLFLYSIFKNHAKNKSQVKALPSHLFKNMPVIVGKQMQDYILCTALFTLKYIHEGTGVFTRFHFNRVMCFKMINEVVKSSNSQNSLVSYYLEQLCLQVKAGQIQRAYLYQVLKNYTKNCEYKSEIFKKFLDNSNLKYNLKFQAKEIKVSTDELITELEDDENSFLKEFQLYSEKFIYESVLSKNVIYHYSDRMIWNEILPGIMNSKEDQQVKYDNSSEEEEMSPKEQRSDEKEEKMVEEGEKIETMEKFKVEEKE